MKTPGPGGSPLEQDEIILLPNIRFPATIELNPSHTAGKVTATRLCSTKSLEMVSATP